MLAQPRPWARCLLAAWGVALAQALLAGGSPPPALLVPVGSWAWRLLLRALALGVSWGRPAALKEVSPWMTLGEVAPAQALPLRLLAGGRQLHALLVRAESWARCPLSGPQASGWWPAHPSPASTKRMPGECSLGLQAVCRHRLQALAPEVFGECASPLRALPGLVPGRKLLAEVAPVVACSSPVFWAANRADRASLPRPSQGWREGPVSAWQGSQRRTLLVLSRPWQQEARWLPLRQVLLMQLAARLAERLRLERWPTGQRAPPASHLLLALAPSLRRVQTLPMRQRLGLRQRPRWKLAPPAPLRQRAQQGLEALHSRRTGVAQ